MGYTGQIFDESTGLYYYNARFYDPETGSFTTQDTYRGDGAEPTTLNYYTYCAGDPVNYTDPTGHSFLKRVKKKAKKLKRKANRKFKKFRKRVKRAKARVKKAVRRSAKNARRALRNKCGQAKEYIIRKKQRAKEACRNAKAKIKNAARKGKKAITQICVVED